MVVRFKSTTKIVSNCCLIPSEQFCLAISWGGQLIFYFYEMMMMSTLY